MSPSASLIWVFYTGALGDSVLVWPILRALAPAAFVAPGEKARLAARCIPGIEAVDGDHPEWSSLFAAEGSLDSDRLRHRLAGAKTVISFFSDGRDAWAENLRTLAPEATFYFTGKTAGNASPPIHLLEERLEQLRSAGLTIEPAFPAPRENPGGPVVLHPGSGGRDKCWPADRWTELARRLQRADRDVRLVWGEVERDYLAPAQLESWKQEFSASEPADLLELASLLKEARCVVANDSGPGHLAAALGVRTLSLFGPTDPARWRPRGPQVTVLNPPQPGPMNWLGVERVEKAIPNAAR